jgi:hypothetical protein
MHHKAPCAPCRFKGRAAWMPVHCMHVCGRLEGIWGREMCGHASRSGEAVKPAQRALEGGGGVPFCEEAKRLLAELF